MLLYLGARVLSIFPTFSLIVCKITIHVFLTQPEFSTDVEVQKIGRDKVFWASMGGCFV